MDLGLTSETKLNVKGPIRKVVIVVHMDTECP